MASTANPKYFPKYKFKDDQNFDFEVYDSGIVENNPAAAAYNELM